MAIGLSNHEVYPRVVRCGCPQTVSIVPVGTVAKFNDEWVYNIGIVPTECSDQTYIEQERAVDTIKVKPVDGVITFTYTFDEEQEWALLLAPEIYPTSIRKYSVYSLMDDLYERTPYKGDLHAHSNSSDGNEEPCIVAANYRKNGFDFFALKAHLFLNVIEKCVRQNLHALHDHLVGIHVTIVTRLRKNRNTRVAHFRTILIGNDFTHLLFLALGDRIQTGLRHTITNGGVIDLTGRRRNHLIDDISHFSEGRDFATDIKRSDFVFNDRNKIRSQK